MEQTFQITITSRENHTWQGTLETAEGAVPFQSALALLWELTSRLDLSEHNKVRNGRNEK